MMMKSEVNSVVDVSSIASCICYTEEKKQAPSNLQLISKLIDLTVKTM